MENHGQKGLPGSGLSNAKTEGMKRSKKRGDGGRMAFLLWFKA